MAESALKMMAAAGAQPAFQGPDDSQLKVIADLANEQLVLQRRIATGEELLKTLHRDLHTLRTETIPAAMLAANTRQFGLLDGSSLTIEKKYFANIPTEDAISEAGSEELAGNLRGRRAGCFQWLRRHKHSGIIKNFLTVTFGKDEDKRAKGLQAWLNAEKIPFEKREGVHPMTLKSFVRERYEAGKTLPADLFAVQILDVSRIDPPRQPKIKKESI